MKTDAKDLKKQIPVNIDPNLVRQIKIPHGQFNLKLWPILWRTTLIVSLSLVPIDYFRLGTLFISGPGIIAWLFHTGIISILISGLVRGLFKYEINEFGVKCFNLKGGTWFIEWDNFEKVEKKSFLGFEYISIKPTDNWDAFAVSLCMQNYDLFKALCYKINKGNHAIIPFL